MAGWTHKANIEAVIFDVGGVLAHDVWEHLLLDEKKGIAKICNLNVEQVRAAGQELWETFSHQPARTDYDRQELEREYWSQFSKQFQTSLSVSDFIRLTDDFIRPVEGMVDILERLKSRDVHLAICSNNTEFWFHRQMEKLGLQRFFNTNEIILSTRVGVSKMSPDLEMYDAVIKCLDTAPDCCIFIDDREINIERALQSGISGIIFPSGANYGSQYLCLLFKKMGVL